MAKTMSKPWNLPSGGSATHPEVQEQVVQHPARHVVVFWRLAVPYRGQHVLGVRADVVSASQMACHALHRPHAPLSPPQLFDSHPLGISTVKIPKVEQGTRALEDHGWGPARWLPRSRGSPSLCFLNCGGRRSATASNAALLAGQACTSTTATLTINQPFVCRKILHSNYGCGRSMEYSRPRRDWDQARMRFYPRHQGAIRHHPSCSLLSKHLMWRRERGGAVSTTIPPLRTGNPNTSEIHTDRCNAEQVIVAPSDSIHNTASWTFAR
ncbi:hypothetical protein Landi51_12719 [Colletotrichum acutatum]